MTEAQPPAGDSRRGEHGRLARSFTRGADRYARLRPGYPEEAARFLTGDEPVDIADVGAGSGKFTAVLAALGHRLTAVEPSPAMRDQLGVLLPDVRVLDGTGESTGLPDGSVDVVTFAQSWHWVDVAAGSAELARILRPGGVVGMVWNAFDDTVPWISRLQEAMHDTPLARDRGRDSVETAAAEAPVGPFGAAERRTVPWSHRMTLADLAELVTTRSYYLAAPPEAREAVIAGVRRTLRRDHPGRPGGTVVDVPYRAICVRYRLG